MPLLGVVEVALGVIVLFGFVTKAAAVAAALLLGGAVLVSPEAPAGLRHHALLASAGVALALLAFGAGTHAADTLLANRTTMTRRAAAQTLSGLGAVTLGVLLLRLLPVFGLGAPWSLAVAGVIVLGGLAGMWLNNPVCDCAADTPIAADGGLLLVRLSLAYSLLAAAVFPQWSPYWTLPFGVLLVAAVLLGLGLFARLSALILLAGFAALFAVHGIAGETTLVLAAATAVLALGGAGRHSIIGWLLARTPRAGHEGGGSAPVQDEAGPGSATASTPASARER